MESAIKKAIEGGWKAFGHCRSTCPEPATFELSIDRKTIIFHEDNSVVDHAIDNVAYLTSDIFLDPLFWKCLGKALGWDENIYDSVPCELCSKLSCEHKVVKGEIITAMKDNKNWLYRWHRFIDHLAEGKAAEFFFTDLMK